MQKPIKKSKYESSIVIRVKPEERCRIEHIAELEQRPLGSMCRFFALKGLADYEQSLQSAATVTAIPTTAT